jgi:hypothetical protein
VDELGGARDRLVAAVDHPVEVEHDETDAIREVGHPADDTAATQSITGRISLESVASEAV